MKISVLTVIVLDRSRFFESYLYIKYMLKLNFAGKRIISCIERLSTSFQLFPKSAQTKYYKLISSKTLADYREQITK